MAAWRGAAGTHGTHHPMQPSAEHSSFYSIKTKQNPTRECEGSRAKQIKRKIWLQIPSCLGCRSMFPAKVHLHEVQHEPNWSIGQGCLLLHTAVNRAQPLSLPEPITSAPTVSETAEKNPGKGRTESRESLKPRQREEENSSLQMVWDSRSRACQAGLMLRPSSQQLSGYMSTDLLSWAC